MSVSTDAPESNGIAEIIPFFEWSPVGVVVLAVLLIFTGQLIPRPIYKEAIKDRNHWRELAQTLAEQNRELLVTARVMSGDRTER